MERRVVGYGHDWIGLEVHPSPWKSGDVGTIETRHGSMDWKNEWRSA